MGLTASELLSAFRLYLFLPHPVKETIPGRLEVSPPSWMLYDRCEMCLRCTFLRAPLRLAVGHRSLLFAGNLSSLYFQRSNEFEVNRNPRICIRLGVVNFLVNVYKLNNF